MIRIPNSNYTFHYDATNEIIRNVISDAKIGDKDRLRAINRLSSFYS